MQLEALLLSLNLDASTMSVQIESYKNFERDDLVLLTAELPHYSRIGKTTKKNRDRSSSVQ